MTEWAVFLNNLDSIAKLPDYDALYFGADYCPHLMPGLAEIIPAYEECQRLDRPFTLVTPLCFEVVRPRFESLLAEFVNLVQTAEVVVNDWGLFEYMQGLPQLTPVIGRLLTRAKRFGQALSLSETDKSHFATLPLAHPHISGWLKKLGVTRLEVDSGEGLDFRQIDETNLKLSVYLPYSVVSVTRYCSAAYDPECGWRNYRDCAKACRENVIYLANPELTRPLIVKGCARLLESGPGLDKELETNVDRLIFWPDAL